MKSHSIVHFVGWKDPVRPERPRIGQAAAEEEAGRAQRSFALASSYQTYLV
jgi:hypothetical protein